MSKHFIEEVFLILGCVFYMWLINSCIVLLFYTGNSWYQWYSVLTKTRVVGYTAWFNISPDVLVAILLLLLLLLSLFHLVNFFSWNDRPSKNLRWHELIVLCVSCFLIEFFSMNGFTHFYDFCVNKERWKIMLCISCRYKIILDIGVYLKPHFYK